VKENVIAIGLPQKTGKVPIVLLQFRYINDAVTDG
jgi:hypothetical protein